ncbi:WD repeat-containing protein 46 [Pseudozyma hubeiensis SY62]|uniref:WD repeat-containing protein 46 n=1 Tax=Pseudozyma hubeiensis (strain SY62) TaxID=1305764 RepID=R9P359_PSEHS|nr:WD repeat-containing protein 46 [Pseudozyma hubeiensis SY62]GAC95739.1 WD repeat-containing protein 46 [Pseudozyma hubeiensis SY62]
MIRTTGSAGIDSSRSTSRPTLALACIRAFGVSNTAPWALLHFGKSRKRSRIRPMVSNSTAPRNTPHHGLLASAEPQEVPRCISTARCGENLIKLCRSCVSQVWPGPVKVDTANTLCLRSFALWGQCSEHLFEITLDLSARKLDDGQIGKQGYVGKVGVVALLHLKASRNAGDICQELLDLIVLVGR